MRYKEFLLAVLFMISATTMRVYAAPDCAEILKYRGEVTRPAETKHITQDASLADPETKVYIDIEDFEGVLTKVLTGGSAADSRYVTNQTSPSYNVGGYSGSLTSYVYSGSYTPAVLRWQGNVIKPASDTRVWRWQGDVIKPASDTRVWRWQGNVTRPASTETKAQSASATAFASQNSAPAFSSTLNFNDSTWSGTLTKSGSPVMGDWSLTYGHQVTETWRAHGAASSSAAISMAQSYASGRGFRYDSTVSTVIWDGGGYEVTFKYSSRLWTQNYSGTVSRNIPADTKYVTNQTSQNYNSGGYTGTLTQYVYSGSYTPEDTKYVTNQTSQNYNNGGYTGTLTQYVYSGSYVPSDTKYVTNQASQNYSSGGYTGTLTQYTHEAAVDTRVWRYQGEVYRPETRTFKYQGDVSREESKMMVVNQDHPVYDSGGYYGPLEQYTFKEEDISKVSYVDYNGDIISEQFIGCEDSSTHPAFSGNKIGYTFNGWDNDGSNIIEDTTIKAVYTANEDTPYKVEHYLQDTEGDGYTLYEVTDHNGTSDTEAVVHPMSKQGWKGVADHPENTLSGNINADGSSVLKVYYDRETFSVKYVDKDGNLLEEQIIRFGGKSILPTPPSLDGYDFNGWMEKP